MSNLHRQVSSVISKSLVVTGLLLSVAGCEKGAQHPDTKCTLGTACYAEDNQEFGGSVGEGFDDPISEPQLVVSGPHVNAVVHTNPFGLEFLNHNESPVLKSVDEDLPNYDPECSFIEPSIKGDFSASPLLGNHQCDRYHALHFEVGEPETHDHLNFLYISPLQIYRQATQYFATHVMSVDEIEDGLIMELATTRDYTTITLRIHADPSGGEALRVQATVNDPEVQAVNFAFQSHFNEAFYGFGARRGSLDQRGNELYSWTLDGMGQWSSTPDLGIHRVYAPQNLFYSSQGYGVMVENTEMTRFYMANDRDDAWKMQVASNDMAFVVAPGDYAKSIETLTEINGRHLKLPEWSKGAIIAQRIPVKLLAQHEPGAYYQEVLENLDKIKELDIDFAAYLVESWDAPHSMSVSEGQAAMEKIKSMGMTPMLYIREMLANDTLRLERPEHWDTAIEKGYVPKREDGTPYVFYHDAGPTTFIDYTNPEAVEWWGNRIRELLDFGGEGFMLDFGEQIREDMIFHNGKTGRTMHNLNPVLAAKETAAVVDQYEKENPGREIMYFTRASFTGRPGSAAYEHAQFLGDNLQSWNASVGLPAVITDILNRGLGGSYNLSTDIAGYMDWLGNRADKELFIRWTQVATFVPVFRLHNSPLGDMIKPWDFDDETVQQFKDTIALRKRALPYMNQLWEEAAATGMPLWRAMWLSFPDDTRFRNVKDQFMLGDDVLVAPVLKEGATTKSVILPEGCWKEMNSGMTYSGDQTVEVDAPLLQLPYFFRCGSNPF